MEKALRVLLGLSFLVGCDTPPNIKDDDVKEVSQTSPKDTTETPKQPEPIKPNLKPKPSSPEETGELSEELQGTDFYRMCSDSNTSSEIQQTIAEIKRVVGKQDCKDADAVLSTTKVLNLKNITDIRPLEGLTGLTDLSLTSQSRVTVDWSSLRGLSSLKHLHIEGYELESTDELVAQVEGLPITLFTLIDTNTRDISNLHLLTEVTNLNLRHNHIQDISPIAGMSRLSLLALGGNKISDIGVLEGLTKLIVLNLNNNPIRDLSPLKNIPLKAVLLDGIHFEKTIENCPTDAVSVRLSKWCAQ